MSVRNCPSPRLDGKHLWLYIERAHLGFKLRRRSPPLGGAADTFSKVWPGLWSASVCNIYVLNGLLLHIEGCMILGVYKLENNHVLSLLEIVCPGICTLSPPRWTKPRSSHPHISDIFFFCPIMLSVQGREVIFILSVHLFMLLFRFMGNSWLSLLCTKRVETEARLTAPCGRARGSLSRHTSIHPSSGMNICGVAVFSQSRQIFVQFY